MYRRLLLFFPILVLMIVSGCGDEVTNVYNQGLDCGLLRSDLLGTWQIRFATDASIHLSNCQCNVADCDPNNYNGTSVAVSSVPATYGPVTVYGSDASASFQVVGDRSDTGNTQAVAAEFFGSFQADSCLALFRVWNNDAKAYVQCIGTFDRGSRTVSGTCDSLEIDTGPDNVIDVTCDSDLVDVGAAAI